jgi:hypothetical protein
MKLPCALFCYFSEIFACKPAKALTADLDARLIPR